MNAINVTEYTQTLGAKAKAASALVTLVRATPGALGEACERGLLGGLELDACLLLGINGFAGFEGKLCVVEAEPDLVVLVGADPL